MRRVLLTSGLVLLVALSGCNTGPRTVIVKGRLTNSGKSVVPDRRSGLTMVFSPDPATGNTFPAGFNSDDDTYSVYGPQQNGIPQGKYRVTLSMMVPTTTADGKDLPAAMAQTWRHLAEQFNSKYSGGNSPIVVEVKDPNVDIDLSKY
jgi:hypothetical protein